MVKRLPKDVVDFLLGDPKEVERVQSRMKDVEERRTRPMREAAERERIAKLPLKPCPGAGGYGCGRPTPGGYLCEGCIEEYRNDPDAFK